MFTSLVLTVVALTLAYVAFAFVAETGNPFSRPRGPKRRHRWRLGRAAALALFVGATCAVWLPALLGFTLGGAVAVGALAALPIAVRAWLRYRKRSATWEFE